jgi:hypothetical protein
MRLIACVTLGLLLLGSQFHSSAIQSQPTVGMVAIQRLATTPTPQPKPPAGATARCRDGTYSFSQHRQGTCSHHGGVAEWL